LSEINILEFIQEEYETCRTERDCNFNARFHPFHKDMKEFVKVPENNRCTNKAEEQVSA
jgi:hypothetical protein